MGNFTSLLYNEGGYTQRSYCRRKCDFFLDSESVCFYQLMLLLVQNTKRVEKAR